MRCLGWGLSHPRADNLARSLFLLHPRLPHDPARCCVPGTDSLSWPGPSGSGPTGVKGSGNRRGPLRNLERERAASSVSLVQTWHTLGSTVRLRTAVLSIHRETHRVRLDTGYDQAVKLENGHAGMRVALSILATSHSYSHFCLFTLTGSVSLAALLSSSPLNSFFFL